MDLLEEWLKRNGERATIEVLMEALSEANLQSTNTEMGRQHDIVLLIRLREVREGETIEEMVWDQCVPETTQGVNVPAIKAILQRNESRVLFLLDGYDELQPEARADKQAIPKLLSGKLYPNSTIVITSRPSSGVQQYAQPDCKARIIGFSFDLVKEYVLRYFTVVERPDQAKALLLFLEDDKHLESLTHTPMFLMLVCLLWEENPNMVSTETIKGLYDNLLTCLIEKHCKREGVGMPTDGIPSDLDAALLQLGKLALEALLRKETQLDLAEVKRQNVNWELLLKLGVVFSEVSASKLHPRKQLTFAHKTMQEFLAGRYVASVVVSQDIRDLLKLTSISDVIEHGNLLQFTCGCDSRAAQAVMEGLANISSKEYAGLQIEHLTKLDWPWKLKPEIHNSYHDFVRLCLDILNEKKTPGVLQAVSKALPFIVSHNAISNRQHAALKYYVQNLQPSSHLLNKMALEIGGPSWVTAQGLQFLEQTFPSPTPGLLLDLSLSNVFLGTPELTDRLVSILKHVPGLRVLDLSETRQFSKSLQPIVQAFSHMSLLEELDLSYNKLGVAEIEVLRVGLKRLPRLTVLYLKANIYAKKITITARCMSLLAPSMRNLTGLRELDISSNGIGNDGLKHLAEVLPIFTAMQILILAQIGISATGMRTLVHALRHLTGLLKLDISGNHIGDIGLEQLVGILPRLTAIKVLELRKTGIGDTGMSALVKTLPHLVELQELNVSENHIGDSVIVSLVQTLCQPISLDKEQSPHGDKSKALVGSCVKNTLQVLDFSENTGVTAAGLERVSQLITLPALTKLSMSTHPKILTHLPDTAAMAVAKALPRLPALEVLDLSYISMDPAGFQAVMKAAEEHPTLHKLWYTKEGVPEEADTSARCLTFSTTLERYSWQKLPEWLDNPERVFEIFAEAVAMTMSSDFHISGMNVFLPK
ncbi:NLRC4 [Branchiostoma lanceolatum]|uniref:NLRC4 protein n=1 Tax=Branchiostoma lanceolatum TaxID=7740 RepID=A0A8S4MN54_BRALA|nr:NLRC4 [Branchiostoma lanceolatum]